MPNTYTQIHLHLIFSVKYRAAMISFDWKERLHQYITGIVKGNGHKMLQINSMPDHIHILIGMRPNQSVSSLVQIVKSESTKWINQEKLGRSRFAWQEGYGAFSYSKSQLGTVINYIQNQEEHHKKKSFLQEYKDFLNAFEVEWDAAYLFSDPV